MYEPLALRLLDKNDAVQVLAAALKIADGEEQEMEMLEPGSVLDTAHVELPLGKQQGLYPRGLVEFITTHTTIQAREVGDIEIHGNSSYVEIPMAYVDEFYDAFIRYEKGRRRGSRSKQRSRKQQAN